MVYRCTHIFTQHGISYQLFFLHLLFYELIRSPRILVPHINMCLIWYAGLLLGQPLFPHPAIWWHFLLSYANSAGSLYTCAMSKLPWTQADFSNVCWGLLRLMSLWVEWFSLLWGACGVMPIFVYPYSHYTVCLPIFYHYLAHLFYLFFFGFLLQTWCKDNNIKELVSYSVIWCLLHTT